MAGEVWSEMRRRCILKAPHLYRPGYTKTSLCSLVSIASWPLVVHPPSSSKINTYWRLILFFTFGLNCGLVIFYIIIAAIWVLSWWLFSITHGCAVQRRVQAAIQVGAPLYNAGDGQTSDPLTLAPKTLCTQIQESSALWVFRSAYKMPDVSRGIKSVTICPTVWKFAPNFDTAVVQRVTPILIDWHPTRKKI